MRHTKDGAKRPCVTRRGGSRPGPGCHAHTPDAGWLSFTPVSANVPCKPRPWEAEVGGPLIAGQSELQSQALSQKHEQHPQAATECKTFSQKK